MTAPQGVFVVVPAFQEERVIRSTLEPLVARGYSVVAIDDGSKDRTWEVLGSMPVHRLRHPINLGQGAAIQTGMTYALLNGAEMLIHFDADGQHDAGDIDGLLEPLVNGEADVVLGSRFIRGQDRRAVPWDRRMLLRAAVAINLLLTGLKLTDAHNGVRAMTSRAAERIFLRENGFAHATEILIQIRRLGLRYVERPTHISYTDYSKSKGQSGWNGINTVFDILAKKLLS
jgi:glycosyltransferase involved in cell wall biosynthesis